MFGERKRVQLSGNDHDLVMEGTSCVAAAHPTVVATTSGDILRALLGGCVSAQHDEGATAKREDVDLAAQKAREKMQKPLIAIGAKNTAPIIAPVFARVIIEADTLVLGNGADKANCKIACDDQFAYNLLRQHCKDRGELDQFLAMMKIVEQEQFFGTAPSSAQSDAVVK